MNTDKKIRLGTSSVFICVYLWLLFCFPSAAHAEKAAQLKASGYVNDFANVLDDPAEQSLTGWCKELDERAGAQLAIVTIRSLDGVSVEEFAVDLFKRWGIGHKDNRGVLILLAVTDRKYRVEVGYGLEPILPDGKVGGFGREMVPHLRNGDYSGAMTLLTSRIVNTISPNITSNFARGAPKRKVPFEAIVVGVLILILFSIFFGSDWPSSPYDRFYRRRRKGSRWFSGPWFGGGGGGWSGGGGFGGGGGGFGGFGGGRSGGGGASGGW